MSDRLRDTLLFVQDLMTILGSCVLRLVLYKPARSLLPVLLRAYTDQLVLNGCKRRPMLYASVSMVVAKLMYIILLFKQCYTHSSTQRFKNLARAVSVGFPAAATFRQSVMWFRQYLLEELAYSVLHADRGEGLGRRLR